MKDIDGKGLEEGDFVEVIHYSGVSTGAIGTLGEPFYNAMGARAQINWGEKHKSSFSFRGDELRKIEVEDIV